MLENHKPYPSKVTKPDLAKRDKRKLTVDPIDQINADRRANKIWHDTVIEGTDLQVRGFRGRVYQYEQGLTRQEVVDARRDAPDASFPQHHPKTPLPNPKQ